MKTKMKWAFTLVELLVVITIIGILAGLAIPGIGAAMEAAKRAQAGTMISNVKTALTQYQADYGVWPQVLTSSGTLQSYGSGDPTDFYQMLIGGTTSSTKAPNPRQTVYMEFNKKDLHPDGATMDDADGFQDPWKNAYYIAVDTAYNNRITVPKKTSGTETIYSSVAVWSDGPKVKTGAPKKLITTW